MAKKYGNHFSLIRTKFKSCNETWICDFIVHRKDILKEKVVRGSELKLAASWSIEGNLTGVGGHPLLPTDINALVVDENCDGAAAGRIFVAGCYTYLFTLPTPVQFISKSPLKVYSYWVVKFPKPNNIDLGSINDTFQIKVFESVIHDLLFP